jgi:hypothetical protein
VFRLAPEPITNIYERDLLAGKWAMLHQGLVECPDLCTGRREALSPVDDNLVTQQLDPISRRQLEVFREKGP